MKSKNLLVVFSVCLLTFLASPLFSGTASASETSSSITITNVAPLGEMGKVSGVVGAGIKNYKVAVLISVYGSWWTKPYFSKPLTSIGSGKWSTIFTTGGIDEDAEEVRAYLIPKGVTPPIVDGSDIPSFYNSYDYASVVREYPEILGIKTKRSLTLKIGKHIDLSAIPYDTHKVKVYAPVTWTSADPEVATVDSLGIYGTITAVGRGTTEVLVDLDSGVFGYSVPAVIRVSVK